MAGVGAIGAALARRHRRRVCDRARRQYIVASQMAAFARRIGSGRHRSGCRSGCAAGPVLERPRRNLHFDGFWILPEKSRTRSTKALYVVAAASLTFLASEVLVKLVRTHGPAIDPSLPTTTLTENLVRIVVVILGLLVILRGLGLDITPMLDGPRRRRSRRRARAAGHAGESVRGLLPDGREAHPHRQLHQAVVGRGRLSRRHRLAREPAAAIDEQHSARAERQALAVDRHELPFARSRAGRDH